MIGEQFDYGDEICGAVVSVRGKQEKIAIWTKNAANEAAQVRVLQSHLCLNACTRACFLSPIQSSDFYDNLRCHDKYLYNNLYIFPCLRIIYFCSDNYNIIIHAKGQV